MVETGGPLKAVFQEVGIRPDIRVANDTSFYLRGGFHQVPLKRRWERLLDITTDDKEEVNRISAALSRGFRWADPPSSITFKDWLSQYTHNPKVYAVFQWFVSGFAMINSDELPANHFFKIIKGTPYGEPGILPKGNIDLMLALAQVIQDHGGAVWTRCPAKRILVEDGQATGVLVEREREPIEISTPVVINNTGHWKMVELAGEENFEWGFLKELKQLGPPAGQMGIWIAAQRPLFETPNLVPCDAQRLNWVTDLTAYCPELAPPGRRLLWAGASPGSSTLPVDFGKELDLCISDLREMLPGFDRYAEILLPQWFRGEFPGYRAWADRGAPSMTPIMNLYDVGDGVLVPGYISSSRAVESGRIAVNDIRNRRKR